MKKNPSFKRLGATSTRYWSDTFELLLIHPVFQKDISNLRKRFGIPAAGFSASQESALKWEKTSMKKTEAHFRSKKVLALRKKADYDLQKGKINSFQFEKIEKEVNDTAFKNDFNNNIHFLVRKFALPPSFIEGIESYAKYGVKNRTVFVPKGYEAKVVFEGSRASYISLEIHEFLSGDEWSSIKAYVEDLQEKWIKKDKRLMMPIHSLKRDLELLELSKKPLSSKLIASEYWSGDDGSGVDFSALKEKDRKGAMIVRQAKTRLKAQLKEHFPGVTLL